MPLVHDPAVHKLGAMFPPIVDPRTVRLARALAPAGELPPPKKTVNNSKAIKSWSMLLNDQLGDCVPVGCANKFKLDAALAGRRFEPTDADAVAFYEQVAKYNPNDPTSDRGTDELTALKKARAGLVTASGETHRILGYAAVDPRNADHIKIGMDLFGGLLTGIALPVTAQQQRKWSVVRTHGDGAPGSWGGHCTLALDYSSTGVKQVTWAQLLTMSWAFLGTYCDQLWAVITQDGLDRAGAYKGIDEKILARDLGLL